MSTRTFWWMVLAFAIVEFVGTIMPVHTAFTWWPVVAAALIGAASGFLLWRGNGRTRMSDISIGPSHGIPCFRPSRGY